jgi:hypothetical protein
MESSDSGGYGSGLLGGVAGVLLALFAIFVGFTIERAISGPPQPGAHGNAQH